MTPATFKVCRRALSPPDAVTLEPTNLTLDAATLEATIDPNNALTAYWFEYGTTAALGLRVGEGSAGKGSTPVAKSHRLGGLKPETKYYFAVFAQAQGSGHVSAGSIRSFTTPVDETPPEEDPPLVTITDYLEPQHLLWGQHSPWLQPWKGFMDTRPASALLNAPGINLNVTGNQAASTAEALANAGVKRARLELSWPSIDFTDPSKLTSGAKADVEKKIGALRDNGLRPLIVLNSNHGAPCPMKTASTTVKAAASVGATTIKIDPAAVAGVVLNKTGVRRSATGVAAHYIITAITEGGTATLSQPLKEAYTNGQSVTLETLKYEPFRALSSGAAAEATLEGWLSYVGVALRAVRDELGSDDFDVEIWNELSFGSNFLNSANYYKPVSGGGIGTETLLLKTVSNIRDEANGVEGVKIGNGFANQSPHGKGYSGVDAICKHPYASNPKVFPAAESVTRWLLDGLGKPEGTVTVPPPPYPTTFVPTWIAYFPEYWFCGVNPETLCHYLAPWLTINGKEQFGRDVPPPEGGGAMWITEYGLDPGPGPGTLTSAEARRQHSKTLLRFLTLAVNKGVEAVHFYAAKGASFGLMDDAFFTGGGDGGETMQVVKRLTEAFEGGAISEERSLAVTELGDYEGLKQFEGNPEDPDHPPLYDRDVVAICPFQVEDDRFVVPMYVMSRNLQHDYGGADGFEKPESDYSVTLDGVVGIGAAVTCSDPLTGEEVAVDVLARTSHSIKVKLPLTDSPRLLDLQEA